MRRRVRRFAGVSLLLLPFVSMLWVASYDRALPAFVGIPFFYWYQLAWVGLAAVLVWVAAKLIGGAA